MGIIHWCSCYCLQHEHVIQVILLIQLLLLELWIPQVICPSSVYIVRFVFVYIQGNKPINEWVEGDICTASEFGSAIHSTCFRDWVFIPCSPSQAESNFTGISVIVVEGMVTFFVALLRHVSVWGRLRMRNCIHWSDCYITNCFSVFHRNGGVYGGNIFIDDRLNFPFSYGWLCQ